MSQRRNELDAILRNLLASDHVYFQQPTGLKIEYPCIVHKLSQQSDVHADNKPYRRLHQYTLTYITKDPDDPMVDLIDDLRYCRLVQSFSSDHLNHYVYTIYY